MHKTKSIYVVVVTYNGSKWVDKCFGSLCQSSIPVSVIAIDNGSTDNTSSLIKNKFPGIIFIETGQNLGFGKANNIGIKRAYDSGGDYIFLLNQDAWVESNTIEQLIEIAEKSPEFGIISPMHLNGTGSALDIKFSKYLNPNNCHYFFSDTYLKKLRNEIYEASFINAAAWLMSRNCINQVGGFNPLFHLYGEDDNYVHRLRFHGLKIGVYPHSVIYHDRESRVKIHDIEFNEEIYIRDCILRYCNPEDNTDIRKEIRKLIKLAFKSLIKFDLKRFTLYYKKYTILKKIHPEIKGAKEICESKGLSFL